MADSELQPDDPRAQIPDASARGLRVVGLLGMLLGFGGLVTLPFGFFQFSSWLDAQPREASSSTFIAFAAMLLGCGLSLLAFIGGIACWSLRPWARPVLILYGVLSVLLGLALAVVFVVWFSDPSEVIALRNVTTCCLLLAWPLGTIYGVWVLYFMLRQDVRALLASAPQPDEE